MKKCVEQIRIDSSLCLTVIGALLFIACLGVAMYDPAAASIMFAVPAVFGTTLAANKPRAFDQGDIGECPMIAADIIYEGAAVGIVDATGHAQPLAYPNRFAGFAEAKADNSAGAAAAINVRYRKRGKVQLSVSGAVITDVGQPIYATDDDILCVFAGFRCVHRVRVSVRVLGCRHCGL